jgi:hypothetical protein
MNPRPPCDSTAIRAAVGGIHTGRAKRVAARREQLEVVGRELEDSRVGGKPDRLTSRQAYAVRPWIERPEVNLGGPRARNLNRTVEVAQRQGRFRKWR